MKTMHQLLTALLAVLAVTTIPSGVKAKSSGGGSFNVTTTVYDTDPSGAATLMQSDNYNGTGQASYTAGNGVVSDVYNGTLFLDLYSQTLRTLYITPNDEDGSQQQTPPPPGYYSQYVEMYFTCYDQSGNTVPLQNITSSSGNCRLGVDFGYGGVKYKLDMGPVQPAPGPATGLVSVNCNATSGGQCVSWTITPNLTGPNPTVANLYYYARGGKLTFIGQDYNTFRIGVTNP
jgi:hypothetical protein